MLSKIGPAAKPLCLCFLFCLTILSGPAAAQSAPPKQEASAVVAPFNEPLLTIYGNIGSISAAKRAGYISDNIIKLKKDMFFKPELLTVSDENDISNIVYMDNVILGVTQYQAKVLGKPRQDIAEEYRRIISDAVLKERNTNIWVIIAKQSALSIFIIAVMFFAVKYLNRFFRFIEVYLWRKKTNASKKINDIIGVGKHRKFASYIFKIARYALTAWVIYTCFLALLSVFPATKWLADTLLGYIMEPLKKSLTAVWNYIPDFFAIIVIIALLKILLKLMRIIAEKVESGAITINNFHPEWAIPTFQIARVVLMIFGLIFIFPYLPNSNSAVFKGISVLFGVLVSLGSTSIINNIISGFVITYMRPFTLGDRIKMGEHTGTVIEKTSLVTRIKTPKNEIITIPNSTVMTAATVNYTASAQYFGLLLNTSVTIGYDVPWRTVHKLLTTAGLRTAAVLKEPEPAVLQTALTDSSIKYELFVYTKDADKMLFTLSELHQNIQDVFNEAGVEIMCPPVLEHRNASDQAIPQNYLKEPAKKEFFVKDK